MCMRSSAFIIFEEHMMFLNEPDKNNFFLKSTSHLINNSFMECLTVICINYALFL